MGRTLGRPGAWGLLGWAQGAEAHHGRQRDALVPLRVGRLLQYLAAELENTEDGWMEQCGDSGLLWGPPHQPVAIFCHTGHPSGWAEALKALGSCAVGSETGLCAEIKSSMLGQTQSQGRRCRQTQTWGQIA